MQMVPGVGPERADYRPVTAYVGQSEIAPAQLEYLLRDLSWQLRTLLTERPQIRVQTDWVHVRNGRAIAMIFL